MNSCLLHAPFPWFLCQKKKINGTSITSDNPNPYAESSVWVEMGCCLSSMSTSKREINGGFVLFTRPRTERVQYTCASNTKLLLSPPPPPLPFYPLFLTFCHVVHKIEHLSCWKVYRRNMLTLLPPPNSWFDTPVSSYSPLCTLICPLIGQSLQLYHIGEGYYCEHAHFEGSAIEIGGIRVSMVRLKL